MALQGQQYGYYTRDAFGYIVPGFPPFLTFKVGVMPKYSMLFTEGRRSDPLEPPGINWSDGLDFDGRSNAVACGLNIPGIGRVNLFSVHIYTPTTVAQKEIQVQNLLDFINLVDQDHPARLTIVGGDMNFSPETQSIYQIFLDDGFLDSYTAVNQDSGYTFGLPDNPFTDPDITSPSRIDYLFVKGDDFQIAGSEVVFNGSNGDFVSDHCGVLTEIIVLAPLPGSLLFLASGLLCLAGWRRWGN